MPRKNSSRRSRTSKPIASTHDWDRRQAFGMELHDSEKFLVGLLALFLVFLPWAFGSTHFWAQAVACFLAACCLGGALLPRHGDTHSVTIGGQVKRLALFPVFWCGLLLVIFVGIQSVNTAWQLQGSDGFRWLEERPHTSWLPAGIAAPLSDGPPLQWMLLFASCLFAVSAAWVGLTRRKSVNLLIAVLAINSVLLAFVGFVQIVRGYTLLLGFFEPGRRIFLATFIYHWQGAAYLTLVLAGTLGLALYHYLQALKSFRRSSPSGLYEFIGFILLLLIIFSYSVPAAVLAGALAVTFVCKLGYRHLGTGAPASRKAFLIGVSIILVLAGAVFTRGVATRTLDRAAPEDLAAVIASPQARKATTEIGWHMLQQRPLYGWGAGTFPHAYLEIAGERQLRDSPEHLEQEGALRDWVRVPAELGIVGTMLLFLSFAYLARFYFSKRVFQNPLATFILLGLLAGLALTFSSPVVENLAFFGTWSLFLTFGAILVRVENAVRARGGD
jgi:hypothetical protein